jgi:DNA-binding transcriptional LysR family regulator
MTDIGEIYFLPKLIPELSRLAPGVQLSTVQDSPTDLSGQMETGRVDLAVGWLPLLKGGFKQRRLFTQRYVCLMRRGHPLARGKFGLAQFRSARHALVVFRETGHVQIERALAEVTDASAIQLRVPHFLAVPYIVSASDLIVTVTEKLAQRTAKHFDLIVQDHPLKLPAVPISLFWHSRFDNDAGNQWMRAQFIKSFAEGGSS